MDTGSLILLTLSFTLIFILIQRSEASRRRVVMFCMFLVILLIVWYVNQVNLQGEALLGFIIGAILSFLFWLLIGRYNPVGSSDDIHVLGMDD
jgi:amino acid permease